ncbi:MAG: ATP:cob(I)alamin adenosyltransferase [Candidatus Izemoplasma sp.]
MKNIDDYNIISTKKGDQGQTRNYSNELLSKSDLLFDVLGNNDELSSVLGLCFHYTNIIEIKEFQRVLQDINSVIATNPNSSLYNKLNKVTEDDVLSLEAKEEELLKIKPLKPLFVLPGSDASLKGAYFDLARSVARRAERSLVRFSNVESRTDLIFEKKYLNRLSDLLFIYARNI